MNELREEMKQEAIERMRNMNIHGETIRQFEEEHTLSYSIQGINYWMTEEMLAIVEWLEKRKDCLVYFGILSTLVDGDVHLSLFYVPSNKKEWGLDRGDMLAGYQVVYVHNLTYPDFSEFGTIAFQPFAGGVKRVG